MQRCAPNRATLTEYSCLDEPHCGPAMTKRWQAAVRGLGTDLGGSWSFDLDYNTILAAVRHPESQSGRAFRLCPWRLVQDGHIARSNLKQEAHSSGR